jgi:Na+-driven multidrug efflux pump
MLAAVRVPWWFMVAQLPLAGVVFALVSALIGFLPPIWLSLRFGIWSGLSIFVALRLIFVGWRAASGRWRVTGN